MAEQLTLDAIETRDIAEDRLEVATVLLEAVLAAGFRARRPDLELGHFEFTDGQAKDHVVTVDLVALGPKATRAVVMSRILWGPKHANFTSAQRNGDNVQRVVALMARWPKA
ncbi:MAG: hypothetical protein QOD77_827 [Thermoplasmata archaeon]|jgi:hypothetical protein|nr:hypothetical protein [Thermoplasmata archaeon]